MFCKIVFYFSMFFKYFRQIVCKYSQDIFKSSLQIFFSHPTLNIWNIMTRYKQSYQIFFSTILLMRIWKSEMPHDSTLEEGE